MPIPVRTALYLKCLIAVFLSGFANASATVVNDLSGVTPVRSGIYYLADSTHQLSVQEMLRLPQRSFTLFDKGTLNLGNNAKSYWLKFSLRNETSTPDVMVSVSNPGLDSISFYDILPDGRIRTIKTGESGLFIARSYRSTDFIFPLKLAPFTEKTIYLKISSSDPLIIPVSVGGAPAVDNHDKYKDIFWGAYIGLMLSMLFYNIFIYFSTKDASYLFYIIYVLTVLIVQINVSGYAYQLLWPMHPKIAFYSPFISPTLVGIAGIEFARRFLQTKHYTPRLNQFFILINGMYFTGTVLAIAGKFAAGLMLIDITASVAAIFILTAAIRIVVLGYRPAIFFLVAWGVFLIGIFIFVFKNLNILPYNTLTVYTMPVGSAMEVILLSFALADKINILKKEKALSQAQALREAEKNAQLIRGQNVVLETKVAERTAELTSALSDLKNAQAQLVESEKMASLGQLTAGIAHEINNPINFVISNVKPLRRDMAMLTDVINQVEALVGSGKGEAEVLASISSIKEEVEYDYLISEIDHLLKGISDGSERTAEIVKGLRIFARVDENDIKVTNVHDGLDSTIIIVNTLLSDKIAIERDYGPASMIECFPGKLNQAFLNIISNAIHAIHDRFGDRKGGLIKIRTWTVGDTYNISIADNGCGIPDEVGKKIFEPFYSTKEVGEGTGLGLSIAYNIIKKHEGQIRYESVINEGTTFILSVPVKQS